MGHPFFTHDPLKIPTSLPSCCTHVAPDWQEEADGRLVPVLAEADEAKYRSKVSNRKKEETQAGVRSREPMGARDVNMEENQHQYPTQQAARKASHPERSNAPGSRNSSKKFEIFGDDPEEQNSQRRRSSTPHSQHDHQNQFNNMKDRKPRGLEMTANVGNVQVRDDLLDKVQKFTLQDTPTEADRIDNYQSQSPTSHDVELRALELMHERLRDINARVEASGGPTNFRPISQADVPGAQIWVTRYVDYTSKYGLGFLFSDGR